MSNIHIILDSTAHVQREMLEKHPNLHIVSLNITLGARQWSEDELSNKELFAFVGAESMYPKTSQPAPGRFLEVFTPLIAAGQQLVVITMSGALSGTVQSATTAAQMAGGHDIYVLDSGTTAIGMVKMAEVALGMAAEGASVQEIVDRIRKMITLTHTMFVPGTLEYLHKGGRIGGAAALFGSILQIKPILYLVEGKVAVLDKVRTRPRAVERMLDECRAHPKLSYAGIVHIENQADGEALWNKVRELYPETPVTLTIGGSVLGAHLGPGLIGLVFQDAIEALNV